MCGFESRPQGRICVALEEPRQPAVQFGRLGRSCFLAFNPLTMPPDSMKFSAYFETKLGRIFNGDSIHLMKEQFADASVDLIMTSPPFGLVRKKTYGNVQSEEYVAWFRQFGQEFKRILKSSGSLVIDIGGAWMPGQPTRSLYQYELLVMLCKEVGFHLAEEVFWWKPACNGVQQDSR